MSIVFAHVVHALIFLIILVLPAVSSPSAEAAGIQGIPQLQKNLLSREVMERSRTFATARSALDRQLDRFDQLLDLSDQAGVRSSLRGIEAAENALGAFRAAALDMDSYLTENRSRLKEEDLGALLDLGDLTGSGYRKLDTAVTEYLAARKKLLSWVTENGKALRDGNAEAAGAYKRIFEECEKKMERQKDIYYRQSRNFEKFADEHPTLAEYLKK